MHLKCQDKTVVIVVMSIALMFLTHDIANSGTAHRHDRYTVSGFRIESVVIDAGHGGKDPGCLGSHSREKDIALNIAKKLGERINRAYPAIKVIYTRTDDTFVPLHERARIANRAQADLFISIHCNYIGRRNQAEGTETYIMGLHRAGENLDVAKRENAAILLEDDYAEHYDGYDPNSNEGHILMSMYQNAHLEQSIALAHAIETEFVNSGQRVSRGVKQAGFLVLRKTTMPSVLIETGFLSTDNEEELLSSDHGQDETATSIFNAFNSYKEQMESSALALAAGHETLPAAKVKTNGGAEYFVQLMATKEPIPGNVKLLKQVSNLQTKYDNNFYKYLAGPYASLMDATTARDELHEKGFDGAFVVAYEGERRINIGPSSHQLAGK